MLNPNLWVDDLSQDITSASTSVNSGKLPRGITIGAKKQFFETKTVNLDMGGGRFDNVSEFLYDEFRVTNLIYDPYNRSKVYNEFVLEQIRMTKVGVDTVTCNNVLNVIQSDEIKMHVISQCYDALKSGGKAMFTVYSGDGSGNSRMTGDDQWQEFKPLTEYIPMIEEVFQAKGVKKYDAFTIVKP